jgi:hypothetical protein
MLEPDPVFTALIAPILSTITFSTVDVAELVTVSTVF